MAFPRIAVGAREAALGKHGPIRGARPDPGKPGRDDRKYLERQSVVVRCQISDVGFRVTLRPVASFGCRPEVHPKSDIAGENHEQSQTTCNRNHLWEQLDGLAIAGWR